MRNDALGLFWQDTPPEKKVKIEKVKRTPPEPTWLSPDYLPGLDECKRKILPLMNDAELIDSVTRGDKFVYDIECYINYFLIAFKNIRTGQIIYFEKYADLIPEYSKLKWMLENITTIGFNSNNYDNPMTELFLSGASNEKLKQASDKIIVEQVRPYDILKYNKIKKNPNFDNIDIIEVAPLQGSLKVYGGRLHTLTMQDLPFPPNLVLSDNQRLITKIYCINDLDQTIELFNALKDEIALREEMSVDYGVDLRSKSDAQIAEAVIGSEIKKLTGTQPKKPQFVPGFSFYYQTPHFIRFHTPLMNYVLQTIQQSLFVVNEFGKCELPPSISNLKINIGSSIYQMGIGGLHSTESCSAHVATGKIKLIDKDVTSYYPRIILNLGLYPEQLGAIFLQVFNTIVERRIAAKHQGIKKTANSLKIVINGSFGKFGNMYSILYSPNLLIQTTITGQLSLLMLIEMLEVSNISVVSGNTDGIVIKCTEEQQATVDHIVKYWEQVTGFETEETQYLALYSRDVNNYIAVKRDFKDGMWLNTPDGVKTKGALGFAGLSKNPTSEICVLAIQNLFLKNKPIHETIYECKDITKFVNVRKVTGGAVKQWDRKVPQHSSKEELLKATAFYEVDGGNWGHPDWPSYNIASTQRAYEHCLNMYPEGDTEYLGKTIRWYYGTNVGGELIYAKNGNKVPKSDGAVPLMKLPSEFPVNVDYDYYIGETEKLLKAIGYDT